MDRKMFLVLLLAALLAGADGALSSTLSVSSSGAYSGAPDNRGVEFVIAYMENYLDTYPLELFVTTSRTTIVNVKVTSPKWTTPSINEQFTITAGDVKQLFIDVTMRLEGTVKESKGILVSASDEIVVYGTNKQTNSNDAFLGLPVDVLGTEYYTVTYYPPYRLNQICVVGVTDATHVNIKFPSSSTCKDVTYLSKVYNPGDTLTVTLDRFDAIQIQGWGDLSGAYITSDKPITVFSGNVKTNTGAGTSQDHLLEQLTPVNTWGKRFATVPTPARTVGDFYKFIASESNTKVNYKCNLNGQITTKSFSMLNAGDNMELSIDSNSFCYITADKAVLLTMTVKSQVTTAEPADPSLIIIPPIEQYAADYTFATPKYSQGSYTNFFLFVVVKSERSGLKLNGAALPSSAVYVDIPDTNLIGGYVNIPEGTHTVRHDSPISVFGGWLYGFAPLESYAFPTGMRMAKVNAVCVPSATVVGDGLDNDCDGLIDEELCTVENQNKDDDGDGVSDEDCATPPPIDGNWASWNSWTSCSVTCTPYGTTTSGTITRDRTCTNPAPNYDGKQCVGSGTESASCTPSVYCPIDGNWGSWSALSSCSVTCGSGTESKTRLCSNPAPAYNGASCSGSATFTQTCTKVACPIDGNWGSWGAWGSCSVTCASGTQTRTRTCDNPAPANGGATCSGSASSAQSCTLSPCPVDGNWGLWGSWGTCSVTCASGTQARSRTCNSPAPAYGGANCVGSGSATQTCTLSPCPIDGNWATWSTWGTCTVTCGGGKQDRIRDCTNPAPMYGGAACSGSGSDAMTCNTQVCIIDGAWGQWQAWGSCSLTCGGGKNSRMRVCNNPMPQNGGLPCSGVSSEFGNCNTQACPVAAVGSYRQLCPTGWFTCQSGSVTCIDKSFVCDCSKECEDGSDEAVMYASCNPQLQAACPSGTKHLTAISFGTMLFLIGTVRMMYLAVFF